MTAKRFLAATFAATSALAALCVHAADFYWVPTDSDWHSWSDASNWSDTAGETVAAAPGAGDTVVFQSRVENFFVDLDGADVEVATLKFGNGKADKIGIRNGGLTATSGTSQFPKECSIDIHEGGTLRFGSSAVAEFGNNWASNNNNPKMVLVVHDGGLFDIEGRINPRHLSLTVEEGGRFLYGSTAKADNANANVDFLLYNHGTFDWPNGFRNYNGAWSFRPIIRQLAGEWILGNQIKYNENIFFRIELTGGKISATGDVSFLLESGSRGAYMKFVDGADMELSVASGKTLDMSNATYDGSVAVKKTGAGKLKLAELPTSLDWQEGAIEFTAFSRSSLDSLATGSGVTFPVSISGFQVGELAGNEGTLAITAPGLTVSSVAEGAPLTGSVTVDLANFSAGSVIVDTPDATLRAQVKAAAEAAAAGTDMNIVEDGTLVKVGVASNAWLFDGSNGVTDMADADGWSTGVRPGAGEDVLVAGAGVSAVLTAATPAYASIAVTGGATLRLAAAPAEGTDLSVANDSHLVVGTGVSVPSLYGAVNATFEAGSALAVPAGETFALPAGVAFEADSAESLVAVTVPAGATLQVPGGYGFRNVALLLDGTAGSPAALAATGDGPITFGTAAAGETAYFAMAATNAAISATNEAQAENGSPLVFASPASGGTVVVVGDVVLKDCTIAYTGRDGFSIGVNNPEEQAFTVVVDNTELDFANESYVSGGATLSLENGSLLFRRRRTVNQHNSDVENEYNLRVQGLGRIVATGGSEVRASITRVNGNTADGAIWLTPSVAGHVGLEIGEGGIGCWHKANASGGGTATFADGVMQVFNAYWWGFGNRARIFQNFSAVNVPEGTTMTLCGVADKFGDNAQALSPLLLEAPFAGGGDVVVTNSRSGYTFGPVLSRSDNTCTGRLEVAPGAGSALSTLYISSGANWAGTVVWNGLEQLVDPVTGTTPAANSPVSVSFGGVQLDTDLALRVWKDATTGEIESDRIDIGTIGWSGSGALAMAFQDGYEPEGGDSWTIGTMPADCDLPPVSPRSVVLVKEPIDGGDGSQVVVRAKIAKGTFIILR
ncbi:MAG: hypothetical protein IJ678_09630 [Kiritimatiellae bacterium]|nr:hypothetical protein [Kiritimatiellia bacterium]MBR1609859.1 hypothetical protein [Kiritimatiellia bacterium]